MIWVIFVRYNHEISLVNYAKPNQQIDFVRYNREFVITVIVITKFDCIICMINVHCFVFRAGNSGLRLDLES